MTSEHVLLIGASDFRALRLTCEKCRTSLNVPLNETITIPEDCPVCQTGWRTPQQEDTLRAAQGIGNAFKRWLQFEREGRAFTIRFEITPQ